MKLETLSIADATLHCYLNTCTQETPLTARPAVLIFPGGGYSYCSPREGEPVALAYLAEGYQAFVLHYTTGETANMDVVLREAEAALEAIAAHAENWQVDASRIAVVGFSAGGHLAAMLSVSGRVRPAAQILGYPHTLRGGGLLFDVPGADELVDAHTPPAFVFATSEDIRVPVAHSLQYAAALDRQHVPFELHIYQKGRHGLALANMVTGAADPSFLNPAVAAWFPRSIAWLEDLWGALDAAQ